MRSVLLPCFDMLRGEKKSSRIRYSDGAPRGEKKSALLPRENGSFRTEIPRQGKRLLVLRTVRAENAEIGIPGIGKRAKGGRRFEKRRRQIYGIFFAGAYCEGEYRLSCPESSILRRGKAIRRRMKQHPKTFAARRRPPPRFVSLHRRARVLLRSSARAQVFRRCGNLMSVFS